MFGRWPIVFGIFYLLLFSQPVAATTPLDGWVDVTTFAGDCLGIKLKDRDTCMFQHGLNFIGSGPHPGQPGENVLYIPAGTYLITETLFIEGHTGIQIVGDSSSGGVTLRWNGPSGRLDPKSGFVRPAVMFHADGNKLATYRNITWDGGAAQGKQYVVAFDQSWCGNAAGTLCSGGSYNAQCNGLGNSWYVPDCDPAQDSDCKPHTLYCKAGTNDTASAHFDSVFRNAWIGLRVGHYNMQVDQLTVRRVRFIDNAIGVSIEDSNALQEFFWDCDFERNAIAGITNSISALGYYDPALGEKAFGDFRVMRGWFSENGHDATAGKGDIFAKVAGNYTIRECRSTGSKQFLVSHGSGVTRPISIIGSEIADYSAANAITLNSPGPLLLIDNKFDSGSSTGPVVRVSGQAGAASSILAIDNTYTVAEGVPGSACPGAGTAYNNVTGLSKRCVGDSFNSGSFQVVEFDRPTVVDMLAGRARFTVEENPDTDDYAAVIQAAIDAASAATPALVSLPGGRYKISDTLRIATDGDLLLVGSGASTEIKWAGGADGPMLEIDGASAGGLTLRDLHFDAYDEIGVRTDAIRILNLTPASANSGVQFNRVLVTKSSPVSSDGVVVLGADRTRIDVMDSTFSVHDRGFVTYSGVLPRTSDAGIAVWTSTVLHNEWAFDLYGNGDLIDGNGDGLAFLVSSTYMEDSQHFLRASGRYGESDIIVHGSKAATIDSSDPYAVLLLDVGGNVAVVNSWPFDLDASAEGALIEHQGTTPLSIELMANTIATDPEYLSDAPVIRTAELCNVPEAGDPHPENACQGTPGVANSVDDEPIDWSAAEDALLYEGLDLLRSTPPGLYDEASASAPYQINLDNVHVTDAVTGILMAGFGSCPRNVGCGPGCQQSNCSWVDKREIGCADDGDLEQCPLGETVFVQTCGCSGGLCMATATSWSCEMACSTSSDCNDGLFCNGENCNGLFCDDPCPGQECDEESDQCI